MKKLLLIVAILLTGCTAVKTTELVISEVVSDYCKAPMNGRALIQQRVQSILQPNTIKIICANDQ